MTENNLPNVWDKAKTNDIPDGFGYRDIKDIPEGTLWFNPNDKKGLKVLTNGEWVNTDPFEDLEERKVKKTEKK